MSEVTVASMVAAIMDINDLLGLDPAIETADKNAVQLAALVEKRQKGDEKFLATDFIPGSQNSLKIATVVALKAMKVTMPKCWEERLADAIEAGTEDYAPKAPVAAPKAPVAAPKAKADVKAAPVAAPKAKTTSAIKAEIKAKADAKVASAKAEIKAKAAPKAKAPKAPKAAATEGEATEAGDKRPMNERSARMTELVSKGIEKEEFFKIIHEEFGTTMKTLHMTLAHFKNPKWNRLEKLIVEKDGILTFQE